MEGNGVWWLAEPERQCYRCKKRQDLQITELLDVVHIQYAEEACYGGKRL
jgi:hypothetical protein